MNTHDDLSRIYRLPDILRIYNVSKPTLYRWIKRGTFPPPILLGGHGTRAVGWLGTTLAKHQRNLIAQDQEGNGDNGGDENEKK